MDLVLSIAIVLLLAVVPIAVYVLNKKYQQEYERNIEEIKHIARLECKYEYEQKYESTKKNSSNTARNVLRGQLLEQFVPVLSSDEYNLFDWRFLGDFADFIVIDGYTEVKDGLATEVKQIVFVEIKTGDSKLSKHQQAVKRAIQDGRVKWGEVKLDVHGNKS